MKNKLIKKALILTKLLKLLIFKPAMLFVALVFTLTASNYIWKIL